MKEKKVTLKKWLNSGSKTETVIKKAFLILILIAFYLIYKLGYVIGTLLANISL